MLNTAQKLKRRSWRYLRSPVLSPFSTNKSPKFVKTTFYNELFTRRRRKPDKHSTDQERLSRQRSIPSCLYGADESQTSTRQIKKFCQEEHSTSTYTKWFAQTKARTNNYSITWTTHLKNKQGKDIRAKKTWTKVKSLHPKRSIISCYRGQSIKVNYIKHHRQGKKHQY